MNWFNNMKIRAKLIMCFSILAIFTAVIGIIGVSNMNTLNNRSEGMYNDNFIPVQNLMRIQNALQDVRANQVLALYEKNPMTFPEKLEIINNVVELNNQLLGDYEKNIHDEDEKNRVLYTEVTNKLAEYRTVRNDNLDLIKNEKYDEALATLSDVTQARLRSDEALQKLVDHNTQLASQVVQENTDNYVRQTVLMVTVIAGSVIIAITLGLIIANIISKQLNQLVLVADKIADGNLDVNIDIDTKDEIGVLGKSFKKMIENINDAMSNINIASEQVATGARQVSDSSMALSQGATEQASSIEQLTASLEEISSQTKLNADNANQANNLAKDSRLTALQGNEQMKELLKSMEEINESSNNISKIIKVIDDIAFQTNILALNAAVEAARAGQHGKGFAVVAEEVRTLAARSANAAKETTDMIEGSIKKAEVGTKITRGTAESLNEIVSGIDKVAVLVDGIANASNEQAAGIEQINQGIIQVSDVVQTNSATSEESAAASEELSSQAELLKETVSRFKLKKVSGIYNRNDELNMDVVKMLDNLSNRKNTKLSIGKEKPMIALSDSEFGKY